MIVYNTRHAFILSSLSWGMRRYLSLSSDLKRWHLLYVNALADSYSVTFAQVWIWHWHNSVSNYHLRILSFNKRNPLEKECGIASSNSLEHEWEVNTLAVVIFTVYIYVRAFWHYWIQSGREKHTRIYICINTVIFDCCQNPCKLIDEYTYAQRKKVRCKY